MNADDTVIYVNGRICNEAVLKLTWIIEKVTEWLGVFYLQLLNFKISVFLFSKKVIFLKDSVITYVSGERPQVASSFKCVGDLILF